MGYAYTSVPTFQDKKLLLEAHAGDDYKLLEGKALQEDLVRQYSDEHGEDTYLEVPEYHLLKVKFDSFTYDKERELLNSIASVNVWSSTFVVSMIILSSTYAFYIHLKNELHSKRKTLGTLNLIGVSFKHVIQTYTLFFMKLFASAYLTTTLITTILGSFKPNFKPDHRILSALFGLFFLFITLIYGIFIYNLLKIRKNGFESMKSGGLSFVKTKNLDVSQVKKDKHIIFLDYRFNQPIDNITTGSTVTIYDHIEPFVTLDKAACQHRPSVIMVKNFLRFMTK